MHDLENRARRRDGDLYTERDGGVAALGFGFTHRDAEHLRDHLV